MTPYEAAAFKAGLLKAAEICHQHTTTGSAGSVGTEGRSIARVCERDIRAETLKESAQNATPANDNICDACGGTGKPASGLPCMCGGSGKMSDAARYLREQLVKLTAQSETQRSELGHKVENLAIAAGVELPLHIRAERFLRTSAPHHREREWYKLIEALLAETPRSVPEEAIVERIRFIGVKAGVPSEVYGAMCHAVREIIRG